MKAEALRVAPMASASRFITVLAISHVTLDCGAIIPQRRARK
jgi:hypothetical protein